MTTIAFESFANNMLLHHQHKTPSPSVLFLGNGAAPEIRATLVKLLLAQRRVAQPAAEQVEDVFRRFWLEETQDTRNILFLDALSSANKQFAHEIDQAKEGFGHVACLVKERYFNVIATTRADWLLEDALRNVLEVYEYRVFQAGSDSAQEISEHIATPQISIVKLRGDIARGKYYLGNEQRTDMLAVARSLFVRPMLLVGYDHDADQDILDALDGTDKPLYFFPEPTPILRVALRNADVRSITGGADTFDRFFRALATFLIAPAPSVRSDVKTPADSGPPTSTIPAEKGKNSPEKASRRVEDLVELYPVVREVDAPSASAMVTFPKRVMITLSIDNHARRIRFRSEGDFVYSGTAELPVPLDADRYNMLVRYIGEDLQRARNDGRDRVRGESRDVGTESVHQHARHGESGGPRPAWREKQIFEGQRLHDALIRGVPELMNLFGAATGTLQNNGELLIRFEGARHLLGMPYELLQDGSDSWAIRYAIFRSVQGVPVHGPGFRTLLDELKKRKEKLRVLIVGAESPPYLGIFEHVRQLKQALELRGGQLRLPLEVEPLLLNADERAAGQLKDRLLAGGYHVLCYEGHSRQSEKPGETGLVIGDPGQIWNEQQICHALRTAAPRLVFFNSCVGARTGGEHLLQNRSYLGVMDAAVQAGVPVVLGYRWNVLNSSAERFGKLFLEKLLETRSPPLAVLHARAEAWQPDGLDETWLSPILVAQQVD